jgi:hypothetical protein
VWACGVWAPMTTARRYGLADSGIPVILQNLRVPPCPPCDVSLPSMFPLVARSRGYKPHLLELSKESEQHLLGIDPLKEPETSSFSRVSHDIVTEIEDCLSERP